MSRFPKFGVHRRMRFVKLVIASLFLLVGCSRSFEVLSHSDAGESRDATTNDALADMAPIESDANADGSTDAGSIDRCRRQVADYVSCTMEPCFETHYRWNGIECEEITGCNCIGADCGAVFDNAGDCAAAYATCPAELCRETGGAFYPRGGCGDQCGHFSDQDCFTPIDTCICAPGKTFSYDLGCVIDASCDEGSLCRATGGNLIDTCNSICGAPTGGSSDAGCAPGCYCGPYMTWDEALGCAPSCGASVETQCVASGGTITTGCSDYHCGVLGVPREPCDETSPMCDCGPTRNFVDGRGCVDDVTCGLGLGVSCNPQLAPPCTDGLRCCYDFNGTGLFMCMAPVCDAQHDDTGCPKPND